jgi:hypothetical protein
MRVLLQLLAIICVVISISLLVDLVKSIRTEKYQRYWDKEKALRKRMNPRITNAELCEYYVMFCKRTDCKVDF